MREPTMRERLRLSGIMPANLLPFTADLSIDEPAYRKHLRWLADTRGVTGIVANGHAAEVSSLSREERTRALAIALDEVGTRCPVVAGVYSDGTQEAVALARDARAEGAAGVVVFPPTLFMWGAPEKPEMVLRHFSDFAARPSVDMQTRMKEAPVPLGRTPAAHAPPPLTPVSATEREAIRRAILAVGLTVTT